MHIITTNFFKGHEFERQQGVYMGRLGGDETHSKICNCVIISK